jgi:hypothetical protein
MKRTALISLFAIASIGFASQASALELFFGTPSATSIAIDETFTITYMLDTEGETQITSVFTSVDADPAILGWANGDGVSPNTILFNFDTYAGLSLVSQPVTDVPGDPPGRIRAANFVTADPAGTGSSGPLAGTVLSTLTFTGVGNGSTAIQAVAIVGEDEVTVAQISVTGSVVLNDSVTITVPEPTAGILSMVAIGTVAFIRRRQAIA